MLEKALLAATAPASLLESLKGPWGGLLVIVMAVGAGSAGTLWLGDFTSFGPRLVALEDTIGIERPTSLPERVGSLEDWRAAHDSTVTRPYTGRVDEMGEVQSEILDRLEGIERMVGHLCRELTPEQCPPPTWEGGDRD